MPEAVYIEGLDELLRKLKNLQEMKLVKAALKASGADIQGIMVVYPPATAANSPSGDHWYERGYGSRWRRRDGSIGGRRTSEMLNRKWTIREELGGMQVVVGNNVTYGHWVQGDEQTWFHRAHGWKTTKDVVEKETPKIMNFIKDAIDKELEHG